MKKTLLLVVSFILVIALTVVGTVAYLTDRDSKVNVFTVGDVEIELNEKFIQGSELMPGIDIEKIPTVTNTGDNDAWVWLTFSIPSALDVYAPGTQVGSNENIIHWNPLGATTEGYVTDTRVANAVSAGYLPEGTTAADILANNSTWNVFNSLGEGSNVYQEEIDGVSYNTYVLLYNKALEPGESTLTGIYKLFLDARVDYNKNDGKYYIVENGEATEIEFDIANTKIIISAYAVQTDNIESVNDAYIEYGVQWGDNGKPEYTVPSVAESGDALNEALKNGGEVYLANDIAVDSGITMTNFGSFNGNGNTINAATSADSGINYVLSTTGGEISGINVISETGVESAKVPRALYIPAVKADLYVSDSYFESHYAMNVNATSTEYGFYADNCTFVGWTSYSKIKEAVFTDCVFDGEYVSPYLGSDYGYSMARVRPYASSTFEGCTFKGDVVLDAADDLVLTFIDCYVDDGNGNTVPLTADNFYKLLASEENAIPESCKVVIE